MQFTTIYTDARGETHFGARDVPDHEAAFGPPPNPTGRMADFGAVTTMFVFSVPSGMDVPAHNAPQPYVCIVLSGELEVAASDGEARRFAPGDVLLCEDLTGKGHVTRALSDAVAAFVNRAAT
jgi:quercetin dioxygenase-like cupin family protein